MDWWQIVLIILGSIVVGLALGYVVSYLVITLVLEESSWDPFKKLFGGYFQKPFKEDFSMGRVTAAITEETRLAIAPDLIAEIEHNIRIATEPWTGKLQSFQSVAWDECGDRLHKLPAHIQEDLTQAYVDIRLVNSIVWLATELGRRSPSLDENYMRLCTNIATRLDRIASSLKRLDD